jgi:hypothetical protein
MKRSTAWTSSLKISKAQRFSWSMPSPQRGETKFKCKGLKDLRLEISATAMGSCLSISCTSWLNLDNVDLVRLVKEIIISRLTCSIRNQYRSWRKRSKAPYNFLYQRHRLSLKYNTTYRVTMPNRCRCIVRPACGARQTMVPLL